MELANAEARYDAIHEAEPFHDGTFTVWGEKRTTETPYHFRDGVRLWVAPYDVNPEDQFLTNSDGIPPELRDL